MVKAENPRAVAGSNSKDVGGIAGDRLKSFIERIENLETEKKGLTHDMADVFAEAKGSGFDTKIIRQILRLRKMEQDDRREQEELLDLYLAALGMAEGGSAEDGGL